MRRETRGELDLVDGHSAVPLLHLPLHSHLPVQYINFNFALILRAAADELSSTPIYSSLSLRGLVWLKPTSTSDNTEIYATQYSISHYRLSSTEAEFIWAITLKYENMKWMYTNTNTNANTNTNTNTDIKWDHTHPSVTKVISSWWSSVRCSCCKSMS